jgi:hypothetical protein
MNNRRAIIIAEQRFGAWVEGEQLYFPSVHLKAQWQAYVTTIDAEEDMQRDAETASRFRFNNKKWFGHPRGWDRETA